MSFTKLLGSKNISCSNCNVCYFGHMMKNLNIILRCYSVSSEEVIIPKRIHRGPTDILKALSSTVGRDPTAAHYKYHDDPYLIPTSNLTKRMFALSQESGRKAAMWIKQQHPQLFLHRDADPPIKAYFPRAVYDDDDDVNNDVLTSVIKDALVSDSITVYELMLKKGIEVSEDNKQALLELLSFFNGVDDMNPDLIEERWFSQASKGRVFVKKTWNDGGYAEKIFRDMKSTPQAYSAIIQGMCKYHQVDHAYKHYKESQEKGFILTLGAYNALITVVPFVKDGFPQRCELIEEFLKIMNDNNIKPNVQTFNAILNASFSNTATKDSKKYSLRVVAEMKQLGIEPSLATYYHLVQIHCAERGQKSFILYDIMNRIEGKEFKIQDRDDVLFFNSAMEKCRYYYRDKDLGYRVNELLNTGTNYNFIGDSFTESVYYRNFFMLLCMSETLEEIMAHYKFLVPHVYVPELTVLEELIKTVTMNGAAEYYPTLWSDICLFYVSDREVLITAMLSGMVLNRIPPAKPPSDMAIKLADVAWSILEKIINQDEFVKNKISKTGIIFGDVMLLCLCANEFEKSTNILDMLIHHQHDIVGFPTIEPLSLYLDTCIQNNNVTNSLKCLQYVAECGFPEVDDLARKIIKSFKLTPASSSRIAAVVGTHVFKEPDETKQKEQAVSS